MCILQFVHSHSTAKLSLKIFFQAYILQQLFLVILMLVVLFAPNIWCYMIKNTFLHYIITYYLLTFHFFLKIYNRDHRIYSVLIRIYRSTFKFRMAFKMIIFVERQIKILTYIFCLIFYLFFLLTWDNISFKFLYYYLILFVFIFSKKLYFVFMVN